GAGVLHDALRPCLSAGETRMSLALHLKLAGLSLILLGLLHAFFPRRFQWKEELGQLSLLNRQMFLVHCFFIVLVLLMFGTLALVFTETLLIPTALARVVLSGIVLFWFLRLLMQLFVYDTRLWKGNRFNTRVHLFFTLLWSYYVFVFAWALWDQ